MRAPRARLTALVLVVLALSACEVVARVNIDVRDDGSGTVGAVIELDADAVRTLERTGESLEDQVRLGDLEAAGWSVDWERIDGGATLRLEKAFARPEDLAGVVVELSGDHGPLRDVALHRNEQFLQTDFDLVGRVDLSALETGITEDPELAAALAAERIDVNAVDAQLLDQLRDALRAEVAVSLPGRGLRLVDAEPGVSTDLATSSTARHRVRIGLLAAAAILVAAALVVLASGRHNRRRGTTA